MKSKFTFKGDSAEWNETFIQKAEIKFEVVLDRIFEERIIEDIFEPNSSMIKRKAFIDAFDEESAKENTPYARGFKKFGTAMWIFNPENLRTEFAKYLEKELKK